MLVTSIAIIVAILLAVVVLSLTVNVPKLITTIAPGAPVVAAAIATVSLALTAWNTFLNARRRRRQATLEAWIAWSAATVDARMSITRFLGTGVIFATQAQALVEKTTLQDHNGKELTADQHAEVGNATVLVLNGLERLAVGVDLGIYDIKTLSMVGGTIIKRTRDRFAPYIAGRREAKDLDLRQTRAFVALDKLAEDMERRRIDENRLKHLSA
jgi:hypothetical protein